MSDWGEIEDSVLKTGAKYERILDVGCGDGELLIKLAEVSSSSELWCVDTYIDHAVNNIDREGFSQRIKCLKAEAEDIPLESHFFDFIYSIRSLHEFHSPVKALKEIKRLLASNGEIVIADWKKEAKTSVFERYYGKDELLKFLQESGYNFRCVKLKEIGRFNIILYSDKGL